MKKIIYSSIFFLILIFIIFIGTLSTIGIETSKFNKLISNKINLVLFKSFGKIGNWFDQNL